VTNGRRKYIPLAEYKWVRTGVSMELAQLYRAFADPTRLRILRVLQEGPLCVCHFQTVLAEPQVKISKHLGYLRERELVVASRRGNWVIYALPPERARSPELAANLACLADCVKADTVFKRDRARLKKLDVTCSPVAGERGADAACACAVAG
jgi:ArsR family transcriptional regulator, arsenate/arsenite/antimonite-responsive transcriptional repressor